MSEYPYGHKSQIVADYRIITRPDGTVEQERVPQQFRVRRNRWFCRGCQQFVDDIDDAERNSAS